MRSTSVSGAASSQTSVPFAREDRAVLRGDDRAAAQRDHAALRRQRLEHRALALAEARLALAREDLGDLHAARLLHLRVACRRTRSPASDASARPTRLLPAPIRPVKSTHRSRSPLPAIRPGSIASRHCDVGLRRPARCAASRTPGARGARPSLLLLRKSAPMQRDVRQERAPSCAPGRCRPRRCRRAPWSRRRAGSPRSWSRSC